MIHAFVHQPKWMTKPTKPNFTQALVKSITATECVEIWEIFHLTFQFVHYQTNCESLNIRLRIRYGGSSWEWQLPFIIQIKRGGLSTHYPLFSHENLEHPPFSQSGEDFQLMVRVFCVRNLRKNLTEEIDEVCLGEGKREDVTQLVPLRMNCFFAGETLPLIVVQTPTHGSTIGKFLDKKETSNFLEEGIYQTYKV